MPGTKIFQRLRTEWRTLKASRPGQRFVATHERSRPEGVRRSPWVRPAVLLGALVLFLIGLVLAVMPGPAVLFYALAAGLLATQFRRVAEWLDQGEVLVRHWTRPWTERWRRWRGRRG